MLAEISVVFPCYQGIPRWRPVRMRLRPTPRTPAAMPRADASAWALCQACAPAELRQPG